jgi:hypothetical protein
MTPYRFHVEWLEVVRGEFALQHLQPQLATCTL